MLTTRSSPHNTARRHFNAELQHYTLIMKIIFMLAILFSVTNTAYGDLPDKDGIWDRWKLEGPAFVWYFRGSPHVHTWINIAHKAESLA